MTTSKHILQVNFVFFTLSNNSCSVKLISQSIHYYWKQFLTAVLCACPMTLPSRLSTNCDPSPYISMCRTSSTALGRNWTGQLDSPCRLHCPCECNVSLRTGEPQQSTAEERPLGQCRPPCRPSFMALHSYWREQLN